MKKFKRFFTFGCSFTEHIYPTWADVVRKSFPDASFFNFGKSGAGNLQIAVRIAEANTRYKFNEDDLVMVMFTSFTREDRWVDGKWQSFGNVYNNHYYDKSFYKYCDPIGYAIKDFGLIELVVNYLKNTKATVYCMPSSPVDNFIEDEMSSNQKASPESVVSLYKNLYSNLPTPLLEYLGANYPKVIYYDTNTKEKHVDSHPNPWSHYEYIHNNVMHLNEESKYYAKEWTDALDNLHDRYNITNYFSNIVHRNEALF